MKNQDILTHVFDNGLTLVVESMTDVQSAAFSLLLPGGAIFDPDGQSGTAAVLSDLITRGAGGLSSQQLSAALDNLGLQRHESVGTHHLTLTGATLAENLPAALRLYAEILRRPHIPEDQFEGALAGVEQTLRSNEDEPRQKVMIELRRRCYPEPWGRPHDGDLAELDAISIEGVRQLYRQSFRPNGAIFGVAGNVNFEAMRDLIGELFGDWRKGDEGVLRSGPRGAKRDHIPHESTQTHIGVAYDAVAYTDPDYYDAWAAVGILSGGMSARLFTEVREKRGLCYSVYASLHSLRKEGRVLCYAGTTTERAQETLDVTLQELVRLGEGIEESELDRCKARAKSSLIMQQESTVARSSSIARDWFYLGRVKTLDEVRRQIEGLTTDSVLNYVHKHPAQDFTVLTIGPQPLEVNLEVS